MLTITDSLNHDKLADTLEKVIGKRWCGNEVQLKVRTVLGPGRPPELPSSE